MVDNTAPQVSPRGTDRVRRRAAQEAHAAQAVNEAATLQPLRGEAKAAAIAANKAKEVARFGGQSPTKARQAENRAAAVEQDRRFAGAEVLQRAKLEPGAQVDHRTARLVAKAQDREERDTIGKAARAAGIAVQDVLRGNRPLRTKRSISRRVAAHNARQAAADAAK